MNQLLAIESAFLSTETMKTNLRLTEIKSLSKSIVTTYEKRFNQSLQMSQLVKNAIEFKGSEQYKALTTEAGISWTIDEFSQKVFGFKKAYFYRLANVSQVTEEKINEFKQFCESSDDKENSLSVIGLLNYIKEDALENSEGEGEGSEGKAKNVFTLSYKRECGNIAIRVDSKGEVKTTNTILEIQEAIAFLSASIVSITEAQLVEAE
jgi:hypothetical protein